jgi:hypothetical protein
MSVSRRLYEYSKPTLRRYICTFALHWPEAGVNSYHIEFYDDCDARKERKNDEYIDKCKQITWVHDTNVARYELV